MDDLIRRADAIDGLDGHRLGHRDLNEWQAGWNDALDWVQGIYLGDLPSAQPYTDEEIQAMQDLEQAQLDKAYELGWEEGREALRRELWEDGRDRLD